MLLAGEHMNLKDYLYLKKMTITQFSKNINYSRHHISAVINGRLEANLRLAKTIELATEGQVKAEEILKPIEKEEGDQ